MEDCSRIPFQDPSEQMLWPLGTISVEEILNGKVHYHMRVQNILLLAGSEREEKVKQLDKKINNLLVYSTAKKKL